LSVQREPIISAGKTSQIRRGVGNWIILDVGFSSKSRTCGLIIGDNEPECLRFSEAAQKIVDKIVGAKSEINLLIEALFIQIELLG